MKPHPAKSLRRRKSSKEKKIASLFLDSFKKENKKDSFGDKESRKIEPSADVCRRFFYMVQLADDLAVQAVR